MVQAQEALEASPVDGAVAIHGPGGVIAALSPDDARATARNLVAAANRLEGRGDEVAGAVYQKPLG